MAAHQFQFFLAVALCLRTHRGAASPPPQALHDIGQQRIPTRQRSERLRLHSSRVTAPALDRQYILAEVMG